MRPAPILVCVCSLIVAAWIVVRMGSPPVEVETRQSVEPELLALGPQPVATVDKTEHDFGAMDHLDSGSHDFTITNTGKGPLRLQVGDTTCSCTIGKLSRNELGPDESTRITLEWTIKFETPQFSHSAEIKTNDPENPSIKLSVKGRVIVGLAAYPPSELEFGYIPYGQTGIGKKSLIHDAAEHFEIIDYEVTHPWIDVSFQPLTEAELEEIASTQLGLPQEVAGDAAGKQRGPKFGYSIMMAANPHDIQSRFTGTLKLTTNIKKNGTYELKYNGTYPGPLEFIALPGTKYSADSMAIGGGRFDAADGKTSELLMLVRGFDEELEIGEITADPDWAKVTLARDQNAAAGPGKPQRFRLKIDIPPDLPPMIRGRGNPVVIKIKTNHPQFEVLRLEYSYTSL